MSPVQLSIQEKTQKLSEAVQYLIELNTLSLEEFKNDFKNFGAGQHYLIIGIEAITDIGNYILKQGFNKAAKSYEDIIKQLGQVGVIPANLAERSKSMADFRNLLIHAYDVVDLDMVYQNMQKAPEEFKAFAQSFQEFLDKNVL